MRTHRPLVHVRPLVIGLAAAFALLATFGWAQSRTLTVWTLQDLDPSIYEGFREAHPDIDLQVEYFSVDDIRSIMGTTLASGEGPDVFSYTPGPGFGGQFAMSGLLHPLDEFFDRYGWEDRFYSWTYERETYDGVRYGIGDEPEMIGVFYHRDVFDRLGLDVPETYGEYLEVARALRNDGLIPIAFANGPGWPAYHTFSMFANNLAGTDALDRILAGEDGWNQPEIVEAIRLPFVEMAGEGLFVPGTNSVSYAEGNALFFAKRAGMHQTGMWILEDIYDNVADPDTVGFFAFPAIEEGGPVLPPSGIGSSYYVSAHTEDPEAAGAFLDHLFSYDVGLARANRQFMLPPFALELEDLDLPALAVDMIDQVQRASSDEGTAGMGYNIDVLTPGPFNEAMAQGFQAVIGGSATPEELAAELEAVYEEATR